MKQPRSRMQKFLLLPIEKFGVFVDRVREREALERNERGRLLALNCPKTMRTHTEFCWSLNDPSSRSVPCALWSLSPLIMVFVFVFSLKKKKKCRKLKDATHS